MADEQNELNNLEEPETGEDYDEDEDQEDEYDEEEENEDEEAEIELGSEDSEDDDEVRSNWSMRLNPSLIFYFFTNHCNYNFKDEYDEENEDGEDGGK